LHTPDWNIISERDVSMVGPNIDKIGGTINVPLDRLCRARDLSGGFTV
jgi:hypothetical protein